MQNKIQYKQSNLWTHERERPTYMLWNSVDHWSVDEPWRYAVYANAKLAQLLGRRHCESNDTGFGSRVVRLTFIARLSCNLK
jgi:hypothetical protein